MTFAKSENDKMQLKRLVSVVSVKFRSRPRMILEEMYIAVSAMYGSSLDF